MHGLIIGGQTSIPYVVDTDKMSIRRISGGHKIATFLRKHDYNVEVLDFLPAWTLEELQEFTKNSFTEETFFLGISSTFNINCEVVRKYLDWINLEYPNIKTFIGSQNSTMFGLEVDHYLYGYGEYGVLELLRGNVTEKIIDCNKIYPAMKMDNLEVKYIPTDFISNKEIPFLEFSRGCKFKCSFCQFPHLGVSEDRTRSPENVYDELLRNYEEHGVEHYSVIDETFNDRSDKIEKYANVIDKLPFKPKMLGYIRADLLVNRKRDWDNLIRMGLTSHFYGVESFNQESAKSIGKGMNVDKLQDGLLEVKEYFEKYGYYRGHISLIAGLPYETFNTLDTTISWLENNWLTQSYTMHPLNILKNNSNKFDTISDIDRNWSDYGYEEAEYNPNNGPAPDGNPFLMGMHNFWSSNSDRVLTWKNTNMDLYDAMLYCHKNYKFNGMRDPFTNDRYFIDDKLDWDSFLQPVGEERQTHIDLFIQDYIDKKLKTSRHAD